MSTKISDISSTQKTHGRPPLGEAAMTNAERSKRARMRKREAFYHSLGDISYVIGALEALGEAGDLARERLETAYYRLQHNA